MVMVMGDHLLPASMDSVWMNNMWQNYFQSEPILCLHAWPEIDYVLLLLGLFSKNNSIMKKKMSLRLQRLVYKLVRNGIK